MKFFKRFVGGLLANGAGLYIATLYVPGVNIPLAVNQFVLFVVVLTLVNIFIRPFIKFVLTPVIILTLGLGSLIINALILYFLDFLIPTVTIEGLVALFLTTLIVSVANIAINFSSKKL